MASADFASVHRMSASHFTEFMDAIRRGDVLTVRELLPVVHPALGRDMALMEACTGPRPELELISLLLGDVRVLSPCQQQSFSVAGQSLSVVVRHGIDSHRVWNPSVASSADSVQSNSENWYMFDVQDAQFRGRCLKLLCMVRNADVLQLLLQDWRFRGYHEIGSGHSPFTLACQEGRLDLVRVMVDSLPLDTLQLLNPFHAALESQNMDLVKFLLAVPGLDPSLGRNRAIHIACSLGRVDMILLLLRDARVNPHEALDHSRDFPVYVACYNERFDVVRMLLDDPRFPDTVRENLPLLQACFQNEPSQVSRVLGSGTVDPALDQHAILYHAVRCGFEQVVRVLLQDRRSDPTLVTYFRSTRERGMLSTLFVSGLNTHPAMLDCLLDDDRVMNSDLTDIITLLTQLGHGDVLKVLLCHPGLQVTPYLAKLLSCGRMDIVQCLFLRTDIAWQEAIALPGDTDSQPPLYWAISSLNDKVFRAVFERIRAQPLPFWLCTVRALRLRRWSTAEDLLSLPSRQRDPNESPVTLTDEDVEQVIQSAPISIQVQVIQSGMCDVSSFVRHLQDRAIDQPNNRPIYMCILARLGHDFCQHAHDRTCRGFGKWVVRHADHDTAVWDALMAGDRHTISNILRLLWWAWTSRIRTVQMAFLAHHYQPSGMGMKRAEKRFLLISVQMHDVVE